jgi:hypothetical protein
METSASNQEPEKSKDSDQTAWSKSLFLKAIIPVRCPEKELEFSKPETVLALTLIFGTIALMRYLLQF